VPEADDPIPESGSESRLEVGEGDGLREDGWAFTTLIELAGGMNFLSNEDTVNVGRGSSSGTMIL